QAEDGIRDFHVTGVQTCALPIYVFLEIGPGEGALTLPLAARGVPVVAVEIDRDLSAALAARVPPSVTIITGDILETDVVPILTSSEERRGGRGGEPWWWR